MKIRTIKKLAKKKGFKPTPKQRRQFMSAIHKCSAIRNRIVRGAIKNNMLDVASMLLIKYNLKTSVTWEEMK